MGRGSIGIAVAVAFLVSGCGSGEGPGTDLAQDPGTADDPGGRDVRPDPATPDVPPVDLSWTDDPAAPDPGDEGPADVPEAPADAPADPDVPADVADPDVPADSPDVAPDASDLPDADAADAHDADTADAADLPDADTSDAEPPPCEPGTGCLGEPCATGDECRAGPCVPHRGRLACSQPCTGQCPEGWTCPDEGTEPRTCVSLTPVLCVEGGCDDGDPCTDDHCDPAAGCAHPDNTADCDDGDPCTVGDRCAAGDCGPGPAPDCDDALACTADSCDPVTGLCAHRLDAGSCRIDGACVADGDSPAADPCRVCDPAAPAAWSPAPDGRTCDDGNLCTDGDRCTAGLCGGVARGCVDAAPECAGPLESRTFAPGVCDPATGLCAWAPTVTPCPFGCDGDSGLCLPDPCLGVPCDDPPEPRCHLPTGTCAGGLCTYGPAPLGDPCEDGDPCTLSDACDDAGACVPGAPKTCTPPAPFCRGDERVVTDATCDPADGACATSETGVTCPFGCDAATGACLPDPCLGMTCDDPPEPRCHLPTGTCAGGLCTYGPAPLGDPCEDGDPCTLSDACDDAGACVPGAPKTCTPPAPFCRGDERVVTDATCDPADGACATSETGVTCPFGCDAASGDCLPDPCLAVTCDDPAVPACQESPGSCAGGVCTYAPRPSAPCDDGDPCTVDDACDDAGACLPGVPKPCTPPGPACTPEGHSLARSGGSCAPLTGECLFDEALTICDSGCDPLTGLCNRVVIGEFRTRGPTGGNDEFVSIFNAGGVAVDISNWQLWAANGAAVSRRATVPAGTVLPPRGAWLLANLQPDPTPDYSGAVPSDQAYGTGVVDAGGLMLADFLGLPVDQVGMDAGSAYGEGTRLAPLDVEIDQSYRRRTAGCGPDRDTGDNAADFEAVAPSTPRGTRSCPLACTGAACTGSGAGCSDLATYTTWTATCGASGVCETLATHTTCDFGCDLLAGACRTEDCAVTCDDGILCTVDTCGLLGFCEHAAQSPCCGNLAVEPGEECDDGGRDDGDGCSADCHLECPAGTPLEQGYCWVKAAASTETQAQACARIGRVATMPEVAVTWDDAALTRVAAAWGDASLGDTGQFAPGLWCDPATSACHTHAFGTRFFNHGARPDNPALLPVYTCAQAGASPPVLPTLTVHFIEVGQGDSILLDVGEFEVLIDAGPGPNEAADYIAPYVDGALDVAVVTHPHDDHHGGMDEVLARYQVNEVWRDGGVRGVRFDEFLADVAAEPGCTDRVLQRGDTAVAGPMGWFVLSPPDPRFGDANADSLVLRLVWGTVGFVFTGDMYDESEASVLAAGAQVKANVLKLAHHGSDTSSSGAWLDAVDPDVAIYQAKLGNIYGHPHPDVVTAVTSRGITMLGTDTHGTIVVTTDGSSYNVATAR